MLTDEEIEQAIEAGERVYRELRGKVRGMTVLPSDNVTHCIARAVERAAAEKLAQPSELVQAARDALACLQEYSSNADEDCGDPKCCECHAMRPTWGAINALSRALFATEEKQK
jgi:hypothetical protein